MLLENKAKSNNYQCPYARDCGGCQYSGVEYSKQLQRKQEFIEALFQTDFPDVEISPIIGMKNPTHYRHKVHHVLAKNKNGYYSGCYKAGTHKVIAIKDCLLEDVQAERIIQTIERLLKSFKIEVYNEDTETGLIRHVMIRKGYHTGEIMVILVCANTFFPSKSNFSKELHRLHPEITTIVLNVNDKKTSMVLGDKNYPMYGPGFILDKLCGLTFKLSPDSFYQINPEQTEVLYQCAIEAASLKENDVVLDAYCGIGTIGLSAAKQAPNIRLIGVELNGQAVKDAIGNAKHNNIENAEFFEDDATAFICQMAEDGEIRPNVVFMDPPRNGSTPIFLNSLINLGPQKIVYVSCGPNSLVRDLKLLNEFYQIEKVQPVDMFPFTEHVETVVLLTRKDK